METGTAPGPAPCAPSCPRRAALTAPHTAVSARRSSRLGSARPDSAACSVRVTVLATLARRRKPPIPRDFIAPQVRCCPSGLRTPTRTARAPVHRLLPSDPATGAGSGLAKRRRSGLAVCWNMPSWHRSTSPSAEPSSARLAENNDVRRCFGIASLRGRSPVKPSTDCYGTSALAAAIGVAGRPSKIQTRSSTLTAIWSPVEVQAQAGQLPNRGKLRSACPLAVSQISSD